MTARPLSRALRSATAVGVAVLLLTAVSACSGSTPTPAPTSATTTATTASSEAPTTTASTASTAPSASSSAAPSAPVPTGSAAPAPTASGKAPTVGSPYNSSRPPGRAGCAVLDQARLNQVLGGEPSVMNIESTQGEVTLCLYSTGMRTMAFSLAPATDYDALQRSALAGKQPTALTVPDGTGFWAVGPDGTFVGVKRGARGALVNAIPDPNDPAWSGQAIADAVLPLLVAATT